MFSLLDLGLLSKKIYGDFKDSQPRDLLSMAKTWYPLIETCSDIDVFKNSTKGSNKSQDYGELRSGFYACVYENLISKEKVMVIKGTYFLSAEDLINDLSYGITDLFRKRIPMDEYKKMSKHLINLFAISPELKNSIQYVCGHSLGGILAKMIACEFELNAVAFNSPSVKNVMTMYQLPIRPKSITTVHCKNDLVFNLNPDTIGKRFELDPGYSPDDPEKIDFTRVREKLNQNLKSIPKDTELMQQSLKAMNTNPYHAAAMSTSFEAGEIGGTVLKSIAGNHSLAHFKQEFDFQHKIDTMITKMIEDKQYKKPLFL